MGGTRFLIDSPLALGPPLAAYLVLVLVRRRRWTALGTACRLAAGAYAAVVLYLTLFPIDVDFGFLRFYSSWYDSLNLVPVTTIDTLSFRLNIAMTVPLGAFVALLRERPKLWQAVLVGLTSSLAVEVLQLVQVMFFHGFRSVDVNDLIANTLGCVIGYLVASPLRRYDRVR